MPRHRVYCAVYGCLITSASKPGLSFFKLPSDEVRRSKWLRLISREELINRPVKIQVCEEHFESQYILPGTNRKKLKKNSLPSLNLPDLKNKDEQTQTEASPIVEKCIQTNEIIKRNNSTQTTKCISFNTPQKRKLKSGLLDDSKKNKLNESDNETEKELRDIFHELCDKFLTKKLAETVKAQARLKK